MKFFLQWIGMNESPQMFWSGIRYAIILALELVSWWAKWKESFVLDIYKNAPESCFLDFKFWGDGSVHFYADRSMPVRNMFDHSGDDLSILKTDLFTPTARSVPYNKMLFKKKS